MWEKLTRGEGKKIKISLEEMAMIKRVLEKRLMEWKSFHKHEKIKTNIAFKWEDGKFTMSIGEYFKLLSEAQVEIMKYLIDHMFQEKIEFATIPSGSNNNEKRNQGRVDNDESSHLRMEEVLVESKNKRIKLKGVVTGETKRALMIQFTGDIESWIPKSTIYSKNDANILTEQEFLIDEWILRKNKII